MRFVMFSNRISKTHCLYAFQTYCNNLHRIMRFYPINNMVKHSKFHATILFIFRVIYGS